jgi:hypothetical protein
MHPLPPSAPAGSMRIPRQSEHGFQAKTIMNSTAKRTPIPQQNEQGFQAKTSRKPE